MTARRAGRRQPCDERGARSRLRDAYAGIAASDAACCAALGERSRSQDHRDAVTLLRQVAPGGRDAAAQLERLLGLKDQAQYGFEDLAGQKLVAALRQARALVSFAESVLER